MSPVGESYHDNYNVTFAWIMAGAREEVRKERETSSL